MTEEGGRKEGGRKEGGRKGGGVLQGLEKLFDRYV
jgi:hypothetical protein